jgi:hypothetical protein
MNLGLLGTKHYARHCANFFSDIISFNFHNNPMTPESTVISDGFIPKL